MSTSQRNLKSLWFQQQKNNQLCSENNVVALLTKLGRRGYAVPEEPLEPSTSIIDSDTDTDADPEKGNKTENRQQGLPLTATAAGALDRCPK